MKRLFACWLGVGLLTLIAACGVSEKDYNKVVNERESMKGELAKAREENRVLQEAIAEANKDREALKTQIEKLKTELKKKAEVKPPEIKPTADDSRHPKTKGDFYVIQTGDNLRKIAERTGVSVATLKSLNNITDEKHLKVGQKLKLR